MRVFKAVSSLKARALLDHSYLKPTHYPLWSRKPNGIIHIRSMMMQGVPRPTKGIVNLKGTL